MLFDPSVWGPHYWFFLHTVAQTYPEHPNEVTKRKYYDLLQNMPLFIPNPEIGNKFSDLLDKYPVTPYLESRQSLIHWVHFIHNKVNAKLGKRELSLHESLEAYHAHYIPREREKALLKKYKKHLFYGTIAALGGLIIYLYKTYEV
jgi:FAD-linked sulfhydryl oxidase